MNRGISEFNQIAKVLLAFKPSKQRWRRTRNVLRWVLPDTGQSLTMPGLQNILSKVYQMIFTNFMAYCVTKHFPATIKERKILLIIVQVLPKEVKITNFLVQHNLPMSTVDHLSSLFKEVFPDSKIAKNYASRRTKTIPIINEAFAPHCREYLIQHCKT